MSIAGKIGNEFLVNTTTISNQNDPAVTALSTGGFVVTWVDASQSGGDPTGSAIRAQLYAADGSRSGGEFLVNTTTWQGQSWPSVTALTDGRFVVAWSDSSLTAPDGSSEAVRAQIFNANGTPSGVEFVVPVTRDFAQTEPTIAALPNGGFVVAWSDFSGVGDPHPSSVRAQIFDGQGTRVGAEFRVNTTLTDPQWQPTIAAFPDGHFVVAWTDLSRTGGDTQGPAVRAQVFNADGTLRGGEILVNTTTVGVQQTPSIATSADGHFAIAWTDISQPPADIRAQVFNPDGSRSGAEFVVNSTTALSQQDVTLTALPDGRFVAAWTDGSASTGDVSGAAIRAQVFNADGTLSGPEFLVNTTTASAQQHPAVTALTDGRFLVAWEDISQTGGDTTGFAIRAQMFVMGEPTVIAGGDSVELSVSENIAAVTTVTATDPDSPALTYSIAGGADAPLFAIDAVTGALSFVNAPNFEAPADADHDNSYQVVVRASDGVFSATQAISVAVTDIDENAPPSIESNGGGDLAAVALLEGFTAVTTVMALDPNSDALTYSIVGGDDADLFEIDSVTGALSFSQAPNFDTPADQDGNNSYVVRVRAEDGSLFDEQTITVTVRPDPAADIRMNGNIVANETTENSQYQPAIAGWFDGRYVITWVDNSHSPDDPSEGAIRARIFYGDGSAAGPEFRVNTTTASSQNDPAVTILSNGNFVITWVDASQTSGDTSGAAVRAQLFGESGIPIGSEFVIPGATTGDQLMPDITALSSGGFVAVWYDATEIQAQRFDADGARIGSQLHINSTTSSLQVQPAVTALPGSHFVVTWTDWSGSDGASSAIRAQVFNDDGSPSGVEFTVNATTAGTQDTPRITGLSDGRFVVTWSDNSQSGGDTSGFAVRGQIFNLNGTPSGNEFLVNTTTASSQYVPDITALQNGGFVVTWLDTGGIVQDDDGQMFNLRAQVFGTNGEKLGGEFVVNSVPQAELTHHAVTSTGHGGLVVTWSGRSNVDGDGSGSSIQFQRFDLGEPPVIDSNDGGDAATVVLLEGVTEVTTVHAVETEEDVDLENVITFSITGGVDAQQFQIDAETGLLSFVTTPDFSAPTDLDHDNSYVVRVRATDSTGLYDEQIITVNVGHDAAADIRVGGNILVNTTTDNSQVVPAIASLSDGRFVVTWADLGQSPDDPDGGAIRAQLFAGDGSKVGAEFLVNTTVAFGQYDPSITVLTDGRFVIAWDDYSTSTGDTSGFAVRAQLFNADGTRSGSEFVVPANTEFSQYAAALSALPGGRFVATWVGEATGGDLGIQAQIFNADGTRLGSEFHVNSSNTDVQDTPAITTLADGRFVVAWRDWGLHDGDTSGTAVRAQMFHADGTVHGPEFLVNTTTSQPQGDPAITCLANGNFVITWEDGSRTTGDTNGYAVRGQIFNPDGGPVGQEFVINTTIEGDQLYSAITALPDGRFVVTWLDESARAETGQFDVRAQVFNANGTMWGSEFLVNTVQELALNELPAITALPDGRFVITWSGQRTTGGDTSATSVHLQIFDPGDVSQGPVVTTPLADQTVGVNQAVSIAVPADAFADPDSTLTYAATLLGGDALPAWLTFSPATREFSGTPPQNFIGDLDITVTAHDDDASVSDTFRLTISNAGNDVLVSGTGTGTTGIGEIFPLIGGLGNDVYMLADDTADITEDAGGGADTVYTSVTYALPDNVEGLVLQQSGGAIDGFGSDGNDTIYGNTFANRLHGGQGNDALIGGGGNDILFGDTGIDGMAGGLGDDTYVVDNTSDQIQEKAGEGTDTIYAGATFTLVDNVEGLVLLEGAGAIDGCGSLANDTIYGNSSNNVLNGRDGSDALIGGGGNDVLIGGAGVDGMAGGLGDDTYVIDNTFDQIQEKAGEGTDTVYAGATFWLAPNLEGLVLLEGAGAIDGNGNDAGNYLFGNAAANTLHGLGGNDVLLGGAGADTLNGDGGNDVLVGGAGNDLFVFGQGFGHDTIDDFAVGDHIVFSQAVFANFGAVQAHMTTVDATTTAIVLDANHMLAVYHAAGVALTQNDFLFS